MAPLKMCNICVSNIIIGIELVEEFADLFNAITADEFNYLKLFTY